MSKTAKAAIWIMLATMLSKILGFVREQVLAYYYGTSMVKDVFVLTVGIPGLIIAIIGSAVATTFIPLYFQSKEKKGDEGALKFTNNILNICYVIAIIIAIVGLLFTKQFVTVFAVGFRSDPEKFAMAVKFTRIMISGVLFISGSKLIGAYLQVNNSFAIPSLVGLPYSIIIILSTIVSAVTNKLYILPVGALIAMASQLIFQLPFAKKLSYKYEAYINFKDDSIKKMLSMIMPMLLGVSIGQINVYVDKLLATTLATGKLSALDYASKLNDFVIALFVTSIVTAVYPKLSKLTNKKDKKGFIETVVTSSNFIILVVLPISVGFIVFAEPIVRILFERGKFNAESTQLTRTALRLYATGLTFLGIRDILYRVFYSMGDTKTPMINSSIALICNIVLNFTLIKPFGYKGLAFSTSIATMITVALLFVSLQKKSGYFGEKLIISTGIKSLGASIVMAFCALFIYKFLYAYLGTGMIKELVSVGVASVVGALLYLGIIVLLKVKEVNMLFNVLKQGKKKL
ncbi:MAG: murein biosynthesis integral membrane protein MurJ, partial [Clostridioides sp.]|nr:murein biosynthesis integral membrane protein MurJ [Clostridioides sp.]